MLTRWFHIALGLYVLQVFIPTVVSADISQSATTTLILSICGNSIVDDPEQCDVPAETGVYSTTIVGRQCNQICKWGPYCGDGILQSSQQEECDDGNNDDKDFCSSLCKIEPAGSGGGGTSGGGSGGGGGSTEDLGDTVVNVTGLAYPNRTISILLDTQNVGTVRAGSNGKFEFSTAASPGTASLGFFATDSAGTRSITYNTTFDVTQGAVTSVSGVILPPTIRLSKQNINPGEVVTIKDLMELGHFFLILPLCESQSILLKHDLFLVQHCKHKVVLAPLYNFLLGLMVKRLDLPI